MRTHIAAAAMAAAALLTISACSSGGSTVKTAPDKAASTQPTTAAPTTTPAPKPTTAAVGDTIALHGNNNGSQVDVTLVKINTNAKCDEFSQLDKPTDRWVAVEFRITNTGTAVYTDSPINGAKLADTDGQQFDPTYLDVTDGPSMASDVHLIPGKKALGWIAFEVPKASTLDNVQFAMNSGFADETGQWQLS